MEQDKQTLVSQDQLLTADDPASWFALLMQQTGRRSRPLLCTVAPLPWQLVGTALCCYSLIMPGVMLCGENSRYNIKLTLRYSLYDAESLRQTKYRYILAVCLAQKIHLSSFSLTLNILKLGDFGPAANIGHMASHRCLVYMQRNRLRFRYLLYSSSQI